VLLREAVEVIIRAQSFSRILAASSHPLARHHCGKLSLDRTASAWLVPRPAPDDASADAGSQSARRLNWALLLRRVLAIQVLVCERCGGARRILGG
jgi:hypothetical protein